MQKQQNKMQRQTQIIDLTDLTKEQILERVRQILEQSRIQKFTLLLKREVHQSKTQKKIQKKQNAIKKIKYRYSASTNNNLLVQKDFNSYKLKPSGDGSSAMKIRASDARTLCKKVSRVCSIRSRQPQGMNQSFFYGNYKLQQVPKSLQLYYEGQYQLALIQFFDQERELKKKIAQTQSDTSRQELHISQYAKLMINIGNCYFCEKDYEKAMKFYKKEIESSKIDQKLIGQKYNNLGSCYAHKKQNQQSLKCFNQALKIYVKYPELDCSNLLKNIGVTYFRSGMYSSAQTYFQQSINERKVKSPQNEEALLTTYYKLGLCQKYVSKYEQAINNLLFGLNISERGYTLNEQILKQLAEIYESQERYSESLLYYQKLSDDFQRKSLCQGQIYESVAKIHQKQGNSQDHDKFMRLALSEYRRFNNQRKVSQLSDSKYLNS